MMMRIYKCDICGERIDNTYLYGLHFSNLTDFTIGGYGSTDGKHICFSCAIQLKRHLNSLPIAEELTKYEMEQYK